MNSRPSPAPLVPVPLIEAVTQLDGAPTALLALGIPRCGACEVLPASLGEIAASRPDLAIAYGLLSTPSEWAARADLLWPRGIRIPRASVPAMALLVEGVAAGRRYAGGPAAAIDDWLEPFLGPAAWPLGTAPTALEKEALESTAKLRTRQKLVKAAAADSRTLGLQGP